MKGPREVLGRDERPTFRTARLRAGSWTPPSPDERFALGRLAACGWIERRRLCAPDRVAVPALSCPTTLAPLQDRVELVPYPVTLDLRPDVDFLEQLHAANPLAGIIVTSYFGCRTWSQTELERLARCAPVLVDGAHALPCRERPTVPRVSIFFSLRKVLPDGFGGYAAWYYDQDGPSRTGGAALLPRRGAIPWAIAAALRWWPRRLVYLDNDPVETLGSGVLKPGWAESVDWAWITDRVTAFREMLLAACAGTSVRPLRIGYSAPTLAQPFAVDDSAETLRTLHSCGIHAYVWPNVSGYPFPAYEAQVSAWTRQTVCVPLLHSTRLSRRLAVEIATALGTLGTLTARLPRAPDERRRA